MWKSHLFRHLPDVMPLWSGQPERNKLSEAEVQAFQGLSLHLPQMPPHIPSAHLFSLCAQGLLSRLLPNPGGVLQQDESQELLRTVSGGKNPLLQRLQNVEGGAELSAFCRLLLATLQEAGPRAEALSVCGEEDVPVDLPANFMSRTSRCVLRGRDSRCRSGYTDCIFLWAQKCCSHLDEIVPVIGPHRLRVVQDDDC